MEPAWRTATSSEAGSIPRVAVLPILDILWSRTLQPAATMLSNEVFRTQLSTIMDTMVELVVTEVSRLLDECFAIVMENEEAQLRKREIQSMNKAKTRTFASFMEVLSMSSVEKIALLTYVVESEVRSVKTCTTSKVKADRRPEGSTENAEIDAAADIGPLSSPASDGELAPQFDQPESVNLDPQILSASESDKPDSLPFNCSHCGKFFEIKRLFNKHLRIHSKPFSCLQCGKSFSLKRRLQEHSMTHTGEKPYRCTDCDATFCQKQALQLHIKRHAKEETFTCAVCEKKFLGEKGLERHKCSSAEQTIFSCSVCTKTFKWRRSLVDHEAMHSGERKYCCETCGKLYSTNSNFTAHLKRHIKQENNCTVSGQVFSDVAALRTHMGVTHPGALTVKSFVCHVCGKHFAKNYRLKAHMVVHGAEKPFCCDICGKKYKQNENLSRHKRIHTGQKTYYCDVCSKCFTRSSSLKIHRRRHTGEKPYRCVICGKTFSQPSSFWTHKRRHLISGTKLQSGPKPDCDIKISLKQHVQTHTGEKCLKCVICGESFKNNHALKIHMVTHTGIKPYQCKICGKGFMYNFLKVHMRTHTGEKPYKCAQCGKGFRQMSHLKYHERVHTGVKAFLCPQCGKAYACNQNLKAHKCKLN